MGCGCQPRAAEPTCNLASSHLFCTPQVWDILRVLVVQLVLGTDMKQHFATLASFNACLAAACASPGEASTPFEGGGSMRFSGRSRASIRPSVRSQGFMPTVFVVPEEGGRLSSATTPNEKRTRRVSSTLHKAPFRKDRLGHLGSQQLKLRRVHTAGAAQMHELVQSAARNPMAGGTQCGTQGNTQGSSMLSPGSSPGPGGCNTLRLTGAGGHHQATAVHSRTLSPGSPGSSRSGLGPPQGILASHSWPQAGTFLFSSGRASPVTGQQGDQASLGSYGSIRLSGISGFHTTPPGGSSNNSSRAGTPRVAPLSQLHLDEDMKVMVWKVGL